VLRIGLTGGIGAGKSTVAGAFRGLGAVVVDADALAREVVAPGTTGLAAVVAEFGPGVLTADGGLDRALLGRLVFADLGRRRALEAITHPLVADRTAQLVATASEDAIVVHDVPLIVEKRMGALYHLVVVVDAPERVRVDRLVQSRAMTPDDALARMAAQASDGDRRAVADAWIDNDGDRQAVVDQAAALWHERLVPFEHNVRTGTPADVPERLEPCAYDDRWPAMAARLAARIQQAAGRRGQGVEHIGPTAVPGLTAEPVIDLQLAVDAVSDADALVANLTAAGFPRLGDGHALGTADPVVGDVGTVYRDGNQPPERLHGGADPAVFVRLHVRELGGPAWRTALLLRDWRRQVPDERTAYELQAVSAAASPLPAAIERALDWASAVGWEPRSPSR
jgi:dephospho-CoA kinase